MSWLLRNNEVKKAQVKRNLLLYLEAPSNGGVSRVVELIAERGRERFGICVVASRTPDLADSINNLRNKDIDVRESALRGRFLLPGWIHVPRLARLYSLFRGADIIHFHLHTPFSCMAAILLASVVARKLIITTEHYVTQLKFLRRRKLPFPLGAVREIRIAFLLFVKRITLHHIDRIVLVSSSNESFFLSTFGHRLSEKTLTIPNGIKAEDFEQIQAAGFLKEQAGGQLFVTVVAGLNNQKGHEYLIRSIPVIKRRIPNVKFVFVGEGHLRRHLETVARQLDVVDDIIFAGWRKDIPNVLAASDIFVLPSLFEGMPLSVLEAMATGLPVVATDVDGTADVVQNGSTGFLIPPKDSGMLAGKICELLLDARKRKEFGLKGRARVVQNYTVERMCNGYLSLYDSLLGPS